MLKRRLNKSHRINTVACAVVESAGNGPFVFFNRYYFCPGGCQRQGKIAGPGIKIKNTLAGQRLERGTDGSNDPLIQPPVALKKCVSLGCILQPKETEDDDRLAKPSNLVMTRLNNQSGQFCLSAKAVKVRQGKIRSDPHSAERCGRYVVAHQMDVGEGRSNMSVPVQDSTNVLQCGADSFAQNRALNNINNIPRSRTVESQQPAMAFQLRPVAVCPGLFVGKRFGERNVKLSNAAERVGEDLLFERYLTVICYVLLLTAAAGAIQGTWRGDAIGGRVKHCNRCRAAVIVFFFGYSRPDPLARNGALYETDLAVMSSESGSSIDGPFGLERDEARLRRRQARLSLAARLPVFQCALFD